MDNIDYCGRELARLGLEKSFHGFQLSDSSAKLNISLHLSRGQVSLEAGKEGFLLGG